MLIIVLEKQEKTKFNIQVKQNLFGNIKLYKKLIQFYEFWF